MRKVIIGIAVFALALLSVIFFGVFVKENYHASVEPSSASIRDIFAGFTSSGAALMGDGHVWAWGDNGNGQLGDGTREQKEFPVQVHNLSNVIDVSVGHDHVIALTSGQEVFEWGANYGYGLHPPREINGERNDSEGERLYKRTLPTRVKGLRDSSIGNIIGLYIQSLINGLICWPWDTDKYMPHVSTVMACGQYSLAVKQDGTVWAWGRNIKGVLGSPKLQNSIVPVQVPGLTDISSVACGLAHSLALKRDGSVWAWGSSDYGLLGREEMAPNSVPAQIPGLAGVVAMYAGGSHNFVLDHNGYVWGWGDNHFFQIHNSPQKIISSPVRLDHLVNVRSLAPCGGCSFALLKDGSIWTWGRDISKLSESDSDIRRNPAEMAGLQDVISLKCRSNYVLALTSDGTAWEWGWTNRWRDTMPWDGHPENKGRSRIAIAQPSRVEGL